MPLRIGCDLDGVLANMDAELLRQSEAVFGEAFARELQESTESPPGDAESAETVASSASDPPSESIPPPATLQMTSRQQQRLWRHVATIENFWEGLTELEPCLLYTSPSPRDRQKSRMPSSA